MARNLRTSILGLITALSALPAIPQPLPEAGWTALAYDTTKAPADNPLKGFVPFSGEYDTFPYSMEFDYVGFATLMSGPSTFTFDTGLEPLLNEISGRGHQAIVRVYLDYPDTDTSVPQFLLDAGVTLTPYDGSSGQGMSPDYDNENLVSALESFIAAFGARYDGDPRIGFIQLGLLGHWGEWHTFPEGELFASVATQNRVLAAYDAAFDETQLLVSQDILGHDPMAAVAGRNIGFHDDDFTNATLPTEDFHFWSRMQANNLDLLWQTLPNGGEVQPDFQQVVFDQPTGAPEAFDTCVDTTHVSWLLYHQAFEGEEGGSNGWDDAKVQRAIAGAKRTGYEFYVSEVNLPDTPVDGPLTLGVRIQNRGLAPFYYDWPFQITASAGDGPTQTLPPPDWALSGIAADGTAHELVYELATHSLPVGTYTVSLSVPSPVNGGSPLQFANATETGAGVILGTLNVVAGGVEGEGEGEGELLATVIVDVRDAQSNAPINNATLSFDNDIIPDLNAGTDGVYTFTFVPFGRYTLSATAPTYQSRSMSVDIDQTIVSVEFQLQPRSPSNDLERIADDLLTDFADLDDNDDAVLSIEEARVEEPTLTQEQFDALDANRDGALSEAELEAQLPDDNGCPLLEGKRSPGSLGNVFVLSLAAVLMTTWSMRYRHE